MLVSATRSWNNFHQVDIKTSFYGWCSTIFLICPRNKCVIFVIVWITSVDKFVFNVKRTIFQLYHASYFLMRWRCHLLYSCTTAICWVGILSYWSNILQVDMSLYCVILANKSLFLFFNCLHSPQTANINFII